MTAGLEWQLIGVGSTFGSDDEIGLSLVRALSREPEWTARSALWEGADAATIASSLLDLGGPVVIVDAANMALDPGEFRFFSDQDAKVVIKESSVSTHGIGLAEGLELARILGFDKQVRIFAVQPFDLSPRQGLTPEMADRFPSLLCSLREVCSRLA